jgi:predicted nucleic acid-binding protein
VIVVDASVVLELLLGTPAGRRAAERLFDRDAALHAPHLLDVEVAQVLRRYTAAGEVAQERAAEAIEDLGDLPIARHEHVLLLPRVWQLRHNVTAYDATYLALAEVLDATLLTRDGKLARAAGRARVELLR